MRLTAAFSPERLGSSTTVRVAFTIKPPTGRPRLPVTRVKLFYPAELGIGTSDLGLETCFPAQLEAQGLAGCPPNSLMGRGSALVQVPFGPLTVLEKTPIAIVSGPVQNGRAGLLFLASGEFPVIADLTFGALLLPADGRFGGSIDTQLPLVATVPQGPNVALVSLRTAIGPAGITYRERVKGRIVKFHPTGILLPRRCPRGGFPFAVRVTFQDGSAATGTAAVPCPRA